MADEGDDSLEDLFDDIEAGLCGTHDYGFGVIDVNAVGIASEGDIGMLAYDHNNVGVTAIVLLPGVFSVDDVSLPPPALT